MLAVSPQRVVPRKRSAFSVGVMFRVIPACHLVGGHAVLGSRESKPKVEQTLRGTGGLLL
jgi:hypothetical protein